MAKRPPMYQTMTPFVEFYINGVDVLRSPDGKPRTLVSFEHHNKVNGQGDWTLEVFDPSFVALEELAFVIANSGTGTETAQDFYDAEPRGVDKNAVTHPVMFRYGYTSRDGVELALPPDGMEYFVGVIQMYIPSMQPNGTLITFKGQTTWSPRSTTPNNRISGTFYGTSIMDIVRKVARRMDWTLVPFGEVDGEEEFPEGKIPEEMRSCGYAIDNTEEEHMTIRMHENESAFDFITRLLNLARPTDQKYNEYACKLEYRGEGDPSKGSEGIKPKGYLYYGPKDMLAAPRRNYVYLRDPESDIISFSPVISVFVGDLSGQFGAVAKADDTRTGEQAVHEYTEVDRYQKYFAGRRRKLTFSFAELGLLQQGEPESPDDADRTEGGNVAPNVPGRQTKPDPNHPDVEMSLHVTNRFEADRQMMNFWLSISGYMNSATLEVVGDPSVDIQPTNNVAVYVFVPTEDDEFRFHWTSSVWQILSVSHYISQGSYVTRMDLVKNATGESGITSKAAYNSLKRDLSPGAMRKTGG